MGQLKKILTETREMMAEDRFDEYSRYEKEKARFEAEWVEAMSQYERPLTEALERLRQGDEQVASEIQNLIVKVMVVFGYYESIGDKDWTWVFKEKKEVEELKDLLYEMDDYLGGH